MKKIKKDKNLDNKVAMCTMTRMLTIERKQKQGYE
jgi:hypothetical protein